MRTFISVIMFVILGSVLMFAQDDCATATVVAFGFPESANNSSATMDVDYATELGACNTQDYQASLWFSFTATSNVMAVVVNENTISNSVIVIVDDCTPGNEVFSYYNCTADGDHGFCDLIVGQTYYVMVSSTVANAGSFDISIQQYVLADDDCVDDGTEQNLVTVGELPNNYCSSDGTVWYILNAQGFNEILVTLMGNNLGWTLEDPQIYSAYLNGCPNNGGIDVTDEIPDWECLNSGDVLYLEVGNDTPDFGGFGYSVSWSPGNNDNDECQEAVSLVDIQCDNSIGGTAITSDCITIDAEAVCNPGEPGVWYTFEVDELVSTFDVNGGDFDLFSGMNCNNLDFVGCSGTSDVLNIVNQGLTYYVLVYEGGGFNANASIPAPNNDLCVFADTSLDPNGVAEGNNICASPDHDACGGSSDDPDFQTVYFAYNVLQSGTSLTISVSGGAPNPIDEDELSILVYESCSGDLAFEYDEVNGTAYVCGESELSLTCLPAGDYFIGVGTSMAGAGDFEIQVMEEVESPPNDLCEMAEDAYTTDNLTNSCAGPEIDFCNLDGTSSHDVWYSYELIDVPSDISILIQDDNSGGNAVDQVSVGIFLDCQLTPLDAIDPQVGIVCNTIDEEIELNCVNAPIIYFVVASAHGDEGDFSIIIDESPGSFNYEISEDFQLICAGDDVMLDAGSGYDSYEWLDESDVLISTEQFVEVSSSGMYQINVESNGCFGSDFVTVDQVDEPIIDIPSAFLVCNNEDGEYPAIIDFNIFSNSSDPGDWMSIDLPDSILDDLSAVSFLTIGQGMYSFVYTTNTASDPCENVSDTIVIEVSDCLCPNPVFQEEEAFCNDAQLIDLNTFLNNPDDEGVWIFIDGSPVIDVMQDSLIDIEDVLPGMYSFGFDLAAMGGNQCPELDTITLTIYEPVEIIVDDFPVLCNQISNLGPNLLDLQAQLLEGAGIWQDPLIPGLNFSDINNLNFEGVAADSYEFTFISDNDNTPCANESFVFEIVVSDCDCPALELLDSDEICNSDFDYDLDNFIIQAEAGTWSVSTGNPSPLMINGSIVTISDAPSGVYSFDYTLDNPLSGCPDIGTVVLNIMNQPLVVTTDTTRCNIDFGDGNAFLDLDELIQGDMGSWTDTDGLPLSDPGNVDFTVYEIGTVVEFIYTTNTALDPCEDVGVSVFIDVIDCSCEDPIFIDPPILCNVPGQNVDLNDLLVSGPSGTWSLIAQPQEGIAELSGTFFEAESLPEGLYEVAYSLDDMSNVNCQHLWPLTLEVVEQQDALVIDEITVCDTTSTEFPTQLTLTDLILEGELNGTWSDENGEPVDGTVAIDFMGLAEGAYGFNYIIQNEAPCSSREHEVMVLVKDCSIVIEPEEPEEEMDEILVPNIFSPNGDGNNDLFGLLNVDVSIVEFIIYDCWGNPVFIREDVPAGSGVVAWDGRMNGQLVDNGVYVYRIILDLGNEEEILMGDVTVLR